MSNREAIQIYHPRLDTSTYMSVLSREFGARVNDLEPGSYTVDDPPLPFYQPQQLESHVSILGFNDTPLSSLLILALIDHPELAPVTTIVRWLDEQDVVAQGTLADLAQQFEDATP